MDLILIFHCCSRSSAVSKQVLDLHFTLKTLFVNFFKDRLADEKALNIMHNYLLLPLLTRAYDESKLCIDDIATSRAQPARDGRRKAVNGASHVDEGGRATWFSRFLRSVLMVIDLWQHQEGTWPGFLIVIDLEKVTLSHLARLDLQTVQQFLYFLQKELLAMLNIHQIGSRTIDKFLPMEALPKEAGGQYLTFDSARVRAAADYYVSENTKRVSETARPGRPKTITDIFGGIEGSFKKLDID
ncbi:hypothetical protein OBRU01_01615 [Operophtera brumata]|uniref:Uncharacterized protein n=1 Tax=Operophtera brumata TaxID=104452 RepID=A0A0L7LLE7_OPEBR|nr:hypothetical protein OBRU01_01615 [Operophtera brumata]